MAAMQGKWKFDTVDRVWKNSDGWGELWVQRGRDKRWYLMRVKFLTPPIVLGHYPSKEAAFKSALEA